MGTKYENLFLKFLWSITNTITEHMNERTERKELKKLVEQARGFIDNEKCLASTFIGNLIEAEICADAIDYLFHNYLIRDPDLDLDLNLNQIKNYLKLKRVTSLSLPNKVIGANLEHIPEFLDIIGKAPNHFLLNANGRKEIQSFSEWDNFSRIPGLKVIEGEQKIDSYSFSIFKVVTNITNNPNLEKLELMLLTYLSLRGINLRKGKNLNNLEKLSSLKYLDLKHTKVKDCNWLIHLEKLQILDLRYTYVETISGDILKKLGKLQHLLLGYIKGGEKVEPDKLNVKNQLAGTKLNVQELNRINLKTLRAIEMPENIEDISHVRDVVDLSVTGLTTDSLKIFWDTLEKFHKLTSLGVAVAHKSVITLPDCKDELKENLKRLRMEGSHSGFEKLGKKLGQFGKLNDLTLANMVIGEIPDLPELLCLRLYGVCQNETCNIKNQRFSKLEKLVIGDMGEVKTVQIGPALLGTVVTLKFSNLPELKKVASSDKPHSLLRWEKKTIFLRNSGDFPVENCSGLEIYKYDKDMQCYKLKPTPNN